MDLTGADGYGVMMALLALKKLVSWVSVTEVFCDVRSDSVRAISVTLRSTATPDENSFHAKEQHQHHRHDHREFDGSDTALVAEQFERPAAHTKPDSRHRFHCPSP